VISRFTLETLIICIIYIVGKTGCYNLHHHLCDNLSSTYLTQNLVYHTRMKHISIDIHFVRALVQQGKLKIQHVSTIDQLADCLTKPLSKARHHYLRNKIGVSDSTPTLRGRVS